MEKKRLDLELDYQFMEEIDIPALTPIMKRAFDDDARNISGKKAVVLRVCPQELSKFNYSFSLHLFVFQFQKMCRTGYAGIVRAQQVLQLQAGLFFRAVK